MEFILAIITDKADDPICYNNVNQQQWGRAI